MESPLSLQIDRFFFCVRVQFSATLSDNDVQSKQHKHNSLEKWMQHLQQEVEVVTSLQQRHLRIC